MTSNPSTIAEWRERIDRLDAELVRLLNERAVAASQIGFLKRTSDLPVVEPNRELTIFSNVRALNAGPIPDADLEGIFERIIETMRELQRRQIEAGD